MENLKGLLATVEIMDQTDALLNAVFDLTKDSDSITSVGACVPEPVHTVDANDVLAVQSTDCNDGERAILAGYVSLMRQCIELAEKVGAAKA